MRHRIYAAAAALAVIIAIMAAGWGSRAQGPARRTWEYKVVTAQYGAAPASISDHDLNKLGAEGWELVGTRALEMRHGTHVEHRTDYYFKRLR